MQSQRLQAILEQMANHKKAIELIKMLSVFSIALSLTTALYDLIYLYITAKDKIVTLAVISESFHAREEVNYV